MRKENTKKLKKINIFPVILMLIFVIIIISIAIALISAGIALNLTNGRIGEAYYRAFGLFERVSEISTKNGFEEEEINILYDNYSDIIPEVMGLTIIDEDNILYSYGEQPIDYTKENELAELEFDMVSISVDGERLTQEDCNLYTDKNNYYYIDMLRSGHISAFIHLMDEAISSINENPDHLNVSDVLNASVVQDIYYYSFTMENGANVFITMAAHITMQDVLLLILVFSGIALICFIYFVFVLYMLIRFVVNQSRLLRLYYADKETGGKNWYYFLEKANRKLKIIRRKSLKAAIVHIRMEKYRNFCSCYGEKEGQRLLGDFYDVIQKNITRKEVFARHEMCDYGLLLQYDSEEQLTSRVEEIMKQLDAKRPLVKFYFKSGIDLITEENIDASESYNRAIIARRKIEELPEDNISFFTLQMKTDLLWERKVENDMESALSRQEYKVYLQPKYSVDHEKLAAAEALVRWQHPTEGLVAPYKFIPIFEKNGFITKLDDYMIAEVAKLQAGWIAEGKKIVPISVNVSRAHFTLENLAEHICDIVDSYHVPHEYIELELTESAFFDDKKTLISIVNKMKSYGFAVSMDDFGAGYSSLNSLKELPVDVVKLDAEFFRGNDAEGKGKVIVSEAINLAKKLNMRIVAEGIESREQVDFLAEKECDLIQGYYFAKPMPVQEFEKKVETDAE